MRLIGIDEYEERTMQLARPIYDKEHRILLAAGRTIHSAYLAKLKSMDIRYLFIEDAVSEGISLEEMLDMPTWLDSIDAVKQAFEAVSKKEEFPVRSLQKVVLKLVEEVQKRKTIVLIPTTSLAEELRGYAHAVNVALLSLQIAKNKSYSPTQLRDLAYGAILHDIGKMLTINEKEHPTVGFEYLRKQREINLLCAHVAYQHHETIDGNGYPRGLVEDQIHEYAQIVAIANLYDHLICDRQELPHDALELIMTKGNEFKGDIIRTFMDSIPTYPPGTKVQLSSGEEAIVTKIINNMQRPYVRLINTNNEISLADHHTILITGISKG